MRCIYCDFTEGEAKSMFHQSLVEPKGSRNRRVVLDKRTGDPICTVCLSEQDKYTGAK